MYLQSIAKDNKIRRIVNGILVEIMTHFPNYLKRGKHLKKYILQDEHLIAIDATQYHFSHTIHCLEHLTKE